MSKCEVSQGVVGAEGLAEAAVRDARLGAAFAAALVLGVLSYSSAGVVTHTAAVAAVASVASAAVYLGSGRRTFL